jgi:hypothetical protein
VTVTWPVTVILSIYIFKIIRNKKKVIFSRKLTGRYTKLKEEVPGCILMRKGRAFMQVMNEDARALSALTGLKLQMVGEMERYSES